MMLTKLTIEQETPMENIPAIIKNISYIEAMLAQKGYIIRPEAHIRQIIIQLKNLLVALENSYAQVQLPTNMQDFAGILENALIIATEVEKMHGLLGDDLVLYDQETDARIKKHEPAIYFHLNDIFLHTIKTIQNQSTNASYKMLISTSILLCDKFSVPLEGYQTHIKSHPEIDKKISALLNLHDLSHEELLSSIKEIIKPLEALTPPPANVARIITPLDQSLHPNIIDGVCFGDSWTVLENQSHINGPITKAAVMKQAYVSKKYNNNTYLHDKVFSRKDMSYIDWSKQLLDNLLKIDHNEVIIKIVDDMFNIAAIGHAISFAKVDNKYIYRDVNIGAFEILDIRKFAAWFGQQLSYSEANFVMFATKPKDSYLVALEHYASKTTMSNFLKHLIGVREGDSTIAELKTINTDLIVSATDRLYYALTVLATIHEKAYPINDSLALLNNANKLLANINAFTDQKQLSTIKAAVYFYLGYSFWIKNDISSAKENFALYNQYSSSDAHVAIDAKAALDGNAIWDIMGKLEIAIGEVMNKESLKAKDSIEDTLSSNHKPKILLFSNKQKENLDKETELEQELPKMKLSKL